MARRTRPPPLTITPHATVEDIDAVVIGASLRGLVTAYLISVLGFRAVVVDGSRTLGGSDGGFVTAGGSTFDHGLHVLDDMRSPVATRLFTAAVDGAVHRITLARAIVLRGSVLPYAPDPALLPRSLRRLLRAGDLVDDIGDERPTRDRVARCYGDGFADFVYDEVLSSFPSEARHLGFGVDEADLLVNVYPWFLPRAELMQPATGESRVFHDQLRAGVAQDVLCPRGKGFGGFAEGLAAHLDPDRVEVLMGADDLALQLVPGTHVVEHVAAAGRRFRADHYFWAGGWQRLCDALGVDVQDPATDRVLLGSFRLRRLPPPRYHEILVGDPDFHINRVHYPGVFRGTDEPLMQVEFAVPIADGRWSTEAAEWRARWEDDCRRLGLLDGEVEEFDFRSFRMHFNGYGVEGEPLQEADPTMLDSDTNLRPVVPSTANLNVNRWVPRAVRYVTSVLAGR